MINKTEIAMINYKNYTSHRIFMRSLKPKIISAIEVQKNFMKTHGIRLSKLWHSEAYKTVRYVNFVMVKYNNKN